MINIKIDSKIFEVSFTSLTVKQAKHAIEEKYGFPHTDFYIISDGKRLSDTDFLENGIYKAVPRLVGGKGGFGSMLRAIGAQIEKTTNREACRDLSGRRLRDINEEKRLKNWIASQAERERDAVNRKQKKIERLLTEPKHNFQDLEYEQIRSELPEKVSDAVEQGMKASVSGTKRSSSGTIVLKKKKQKLWVDADFEDLSSSDESTNDNSSVTHSSADCNSKPEKSLLTS